MNSAWKVTLCRILIMRMGWVNSYLVIIENSGLGDKGLYPVQRTEVKKNIYSLHKRSLKSEVLSLWRTWQKGKIWKSWILIWPTDVWCKKPRLQSDRSQLFLPTKTSLRIINPRDIWRLEPEQLVILPLTSTYSQVAWIPISISSLSIKGKLETL